MRPFFTAFVVVLTLTSASLRASAQVRDRPAAPAAAPASDAATLATGWTALAAGQRDAAARAAGEILARTPWNHAAIALRIEALSSPDPLRALDAYEAWLGKRTREDTGLLEAIRARSCCRSPEAPRPDLRHEARRLLTAARTFRCRRARRRT